MKQTKKLLLVFSMLALISCGTSSTSEENNTSSSYQTSYTSTTTSQSSSSTTSKEEKQTITGKVSHFIDGNLENVDVKISSLKDSIKTNSDGLFEIKDIEIDKKATITFSKDGFISITRKLSEFSSLTNLDISLAKNGTEFGKLVSKTWINYEAFTGSISRSKEGIYVLLSSENTVFTSEDRNSRIEVYISTNEVSNKQDKNVTKLVIYKNGGVDVSSYGREIDTSKGEAKASVDTSNNKTNITLLIPYNVINSTQESIIGVSMGLWSETDIDWAPMNALQSNNIASVEDPSQYVRVDKNNNCFRCIMNCYPEDLPYDKDELTKDYPINFADPSTSNKSQAADDIYVKYTKTSTSFVFDMIGFGSFEDSEYIKLVVHTSENNKAGWGLNEDDVTFLINKQKATKKNNLTDFWQYSNFATDETNANHTPTYNEPNKNYFTLQFEVDFSELSSYEENGVVAIGLWEFENGVIYDATPFTDAMFNNGVPVGDLANQGNYVKIQTKTITVSKEELTKDYKIEFSIGGGDVFAKVDRKDEVLSLNLISFNAFNDTDFIRFIIKPNTAIASGVWALDSNDVSIVIYKNASYISLGATSFWDNESNQFHDNTTTLNNVNYQEEGQYWTLSLDIDYTELGSEVNKNTPMDGLLVKFSPSIENNGFKQNGNALGDIAIQNNYFIL